MSNPLYTIISIYPLYTDVYIPYKDVYLYTKMLEMYLSLHVGDRKNIRTFVSLF